MGRHEAHRPSRLTPVGLSRHRWTNPCARRPTRGGRTAAGPSRGDGRPVRHRRRPTHRILGRMVPGVPEAPREAGSVPGDGVSGPVRGPLPREPRRCPWQDSNLRFRLRRPTLYPLSYGGRRRVPTPARWRRPPAAEEVTLLRTGRPAPRPALHPTPPVPTLSSAPPGDLRWGRPPTAYPRATMSAPDDARTHADPPAYRPVHDRLADAVAPPSAPSPPRRHSTWPSTPRHVHLERPARREHGDWSTNVALVTAKRAGTNPRALATAVVDVLERSLPVPRDLRRGRRSRLRQLPARRRLAARGAGRRARPGRGRLRPARHRPRRAGPGRVHLRQSHRADPRGQRLVGQLRRRPGPGARPQRPRGQPRVLRQRHRWADPHPRRRACWPATGARRCPRAATRAST